MKYAVIKFQGKEYKVKEGEEILIDKLSKGAEPEVLLFSDGEKVKIGKPVLKEVKIKFKVIGEEKGEKVSVFKFKAKSRYRKKTGFRPFLTKVLIEKISLGKG
jgi:large subunit ribosomal protein L21